jgi:tetratricopeptide (TPR) repeat protein
MRVGGFVMRLHAYCPSLLLAAACFTANAQPVPATLSAELCGAPPICSTPPACSLREVTTSRDSQDCLRSINIPFTSITVLDPACEAAKATANRNIEMQRATFQQDYRQCLVAQDTQRLNCELWQSCMSVSILKSPPKIRAESLRVLGRSYVDAGSYGKAEASLQEALALQEREFGIVHPAIVDTLESLGSLYVANGSFNQAARYYHRALDIRERTGGVSDPSMARLLINLAVVYDAMGIRSKAQDFRQRADASKKNMEVAPK